MNMKFPSGQSSIINRQSAILVALLALTTAIADAKVETISKWSPHNNERAKRVTTLYIVLHTTEGPVQGSLQKIYDNGEANFFVDPSGRIYATIDRRRVAYHSGRSMWRGRTNLDDVSIGIEVSGYHTRDLTMAQYIALKALVAELQMQYGVADVNVLTHSMVAYGAPNRWHKRSHRGRKRCGMLFATTNVRQKLGLTEKPGYDPDVRAGRLAVGDAYLAKVLYGGASPKPTPAPAPPKTASAVVAATPAARTPSPVRAAAPEPPDDGGEEGVIITANRSAWDVARDMYNDPGTRYFFPDGKSARGDQISSWKMIPPGTRVVITTEGDRENQAERVLRIGKDGASAREIAGDEFHSARTIYFMADGRVRTGADMQEAELDALPADTGMLVGYTFGGAISAKRRAFDVCGVRWNHPSTFYRLPDARIVAGDRLKEGSIPNGAQVFFRN